MPRAAAGETRRTAQKAAIRRALDDAPGFISAQQLHQRLQRDGTNVGLATVYRQLAALAESGDADSIRISDGHLYRACESGAHHHHLICENCGKAIEIDPPEDWMRAMAQRHGYTITRHTLEVFGLCPECAAA